MSEPLYGQRILYIPGGKVWPLNNLDDGSTAWRCDAAIRIWREGRLRIKRIVTSGGCAHSPDVQTIPTATLAAQRLIQAGIPEHAIIPVPHGRESAEEIEYTLRKLASELIIEPFVYALSERIHAERCSVIFRRGYNVSAKGIDAGYSISSAGKVIELVSLAYTYWDPKYQGRLAQRIRGNRTHPTTEAMPIP